MLQHKVAPGATKFKVATLGSFEKSAGREVVLPRVQELVQELAAKGENQLRGSAHHTIIGTMSRVLKSPRSPRYLGINGRAGLQRMFVRMDDDRSGSLTLDEFRRGMSSCGFKWEDGVWKDIFQVSHLDSREEGDADATLRASGGAKSTLVMVRTVLRQG